MSKQRSYCSVPGCERAAVVWSLDLIDYSKGFYYCTFHHELGLLQGQIEHLDRLLEEVEFWAEVSENSYWVPAALYPDELDALQRIRDEHSHLPQYSDEDEDRGFAMYKTMLWSVRDTVEELRNTYQVHLDAMEKRSHGDTQDTQNHGDAL